MTNREAHKEAVRVELDNLFFEFDESNGIDPDTEFEFTKVQIIEPDTEFSDSKKESVENE